MVEIKGFADMKFTRFQGIRKSDMGSVLTSFANGGYARSPRTSARAQKPTGLLPRVHLYDLQPNVYRPHKLQPLEDRLVQHERDHADADDAICIRTRLAVAVHDDDLLEEVAGLAQRKRLLPFMRRVSFANSLKLLSDFAVRITFYATPSTPFRLAPKPTGHDSESSVKRCGQQADEGFRSPALDAQRLQFFRGVERDGVGVPVRGDFAEHDRSPVHRVGSVVPCHVKV